MNAKLKDILRTAWNEPRHFFFWLALLALCGLVVVAVGAGPAGPGPVLAFVVVACLLGFVGSILAFILAWIPPVKGMLSWLLRWRFLALGCVVTLVALFYAVEDWRGRSAWQKFKHEREAGGERFELAARVPPPVPSEQNFFETPLWSDMHFVETNGARVWADTNWGNRAVFDIFGPNGLNAPSTGNFMKPQRVDLAAWQAFYRGTNNVFAASGGPPTNYFPVSKEPQTPAADVLLALSKFNENRQILAASSARPYARFWVNYDAGAAMLFPHLSRAKAATLYLSLHAEAALRAGEKQAALEDERLVSRLLDSIRHEPNLISQLVRMAMTQLALQPVWEGLADRQWTEADLQEIGSELDKLDFLADYHSAVRGERACNLWAIDYIRKAGIAGLDQLVEPERESSGQMELGKSLRLALFQLIPAGWFDQNKLSTCRMHEQWLLPPVDRERRVIEPLAVARSQAALEQRRRRPYTALSTMLLPALRNAAERFARVQTSVDHARLACALERYRLASGQFPETLEALAPKFIEKVPHDVINGQPLKYRRTEDGQFVLYSVGWNQTDDGGNVVLTKHGSPDMNKGDWVWRYPAG